MPTLLIALLESGAAAAAPLQRWAEWVGEGEVGGWERRRDRKGSCRRGRGAQGQGGQQLCASTGGGAARKRCVECTTA